MFLLELALHGELRQFPELDRETEYDEHYDDEIIVIKDICEILTETKIVNFRVSGFGEDNWPVSVDSDLPTILEQLPEVLRSISNNHYPFDLYFYEQGIQRCLTFEERDELAHIRCASGTSWVPKPPIIIMSKSEIKSQLCTLRKVFIEVAQQVCPRLSSSSLFKKWCGSP
jgi:hypothetical protein